MQIAMIGSGNVATHFSAALTNAGHKIIQVWSRNFDHAALLAYHIKAEPIQNLYEVSKAADMVIISVNDDAIAQVASLIPLQNQLVVHTSGSTGMNVLNGLPGGIGVVYPLQTFSKTRSVDFKKVPLLIEGNTSAVVEQLRSLAYSLSEKVLELDSEKRLSLHVAAVFAANFSNYLFSVSKEILDDNQLDFDLLRPLILETACKIQHHFPEDVQTGPAMRNDRSIIARHLSFLKNKPQLSELYLRLSQDIINFYHKP